jgi:NAD(P)-dependent dehydrogenase (short-subunit alcohol dehydrogenase family)
MKILITGTSRGIGLELTRQALQRGDSVIAIARKPESSKGLSELKSEFGEKLRIVAVDVTAEDAPHKVAEVVGKDLDILINNAGVLLEGESSQDFLQSFRVNSVAPFLLTKALLPALKKSSQPRVIQITSKMGSIDDNESGGYYAYRASKTALNMINKSIAADNPWLTTIVVHPGWVKTDMGGQAAPTQPDRSAKGIWDVALSLKPAQSGMFFEYTGQEIAW